MSNLDASKPDVLEAQFFAYGGQLAACLAVLIFALPSPVRRLD